MTVDGQLLNGIAVEMEQSRLRLGRELDSRYLGTVPANLDNRGLWWRVFVPPDFPIAVDADGLLRNKVRGELGGADGLSIQLRQADDLLPVPSRLERNAAVAAIPLSTPVIFDITGDGAALVLATPAALAIPNCIYFTLSGLGSRSTAITIQLEGEPWPGASALRPPISDSEEFSLVEEGLVAFDEDLAIPQPGNRHQPARRRAPHRQ